jgi:hypothetical protein
MSQPLFSVTDSVATFNYPEIDLPQFTFASSEVWSNGPTTSNTFKRMAMITYFG